MINTCVPKMMARTDTKKINTKIATPMTMRVADLAALHVDAVVSVCSPVRPTARAEAE